MYKVITYQDRAGHDEVGKYIRELNCKIKTSKDARIHYKKIMVNICQVCRHKNENFYFAVSKNRLSFSSGDKLLLCEWGLFLL